MADNETLRKKPVRCPNEKNGRCGKIKNSQ